MMQMEEDTTAEPLVITHEHLTITNPWVRAAVMTQNTAPMTSTDSMTMTMDN
jgi:hypothetical protein